MTDVQAPKGQDQGQDQYTAYDHTDLERRRKKLWNLAEGIPLTILGGIDLRALVIAIFVFAGTLLLATLLPVVTFSVWMVLVCVGIAAAAYVIWPHRWRNGLTTEQALLVLLDFMFLQPRRVHGLAADVEPEVVHWRVILWNPTGHAWRVRLARARHRRREGLLRSHPDDELAHEPGSGPDATRQRGRAA